MSFSHLVPHGYAMNRLAPSLALLLAALLICVPLFRNRDEPDSVDRSSKPLPVIPQRGDVLKGIGSTAQRIPHASPPETITLEEKFDAALGEALPRHSQTAPSGKDVR